MAEYLRLSNAIEQAIEDLFEAGRQWAEDDNAARVAKAKAFVSAVGKNREKRESEADPFFAAERLQASLAEANKEACLERVRGLRTQMSAFQTMVAARRHEAEAFGYGQLGQGT